MVNRILRGLPRADGLLQRVASKVGIIVIARCPPDNPPAE
jgi:hypothetical protein